MTQVTIPELLENLEKDQGSYRYKNVIAIPYNHFLYDCSWIVRVETTAESYCLSIWASQIEDACAMAIYSVINNIN
ncbi:MAG: hypothetical protein ACLFUW_00370 [Bacteroidales bacterium]